MLNALAFGLGCGAAIQAWRAWPPQALVTADSLALVFCVGLVVAWFAGRSTRRAGAVAVASAEATAVASNQVNVALFTSPPATDAAGAYGTRVPSESAPWLGGRSEVLRLEDLEPDEVRTILELDVEADRTDDR